MTHRPQRLSFEGPSGAELAARMDWPAGPVEAYALFAHCFTCSKDLVAARTIATALTNAGIAVMRFDFTGLGQSGGDFASTNFSMNLADLKAAAIYLEDHFSGPALLVGHSLGGAAVLAVAGDVPTVKAVATIGAPSDVEHVTGNFADSLEEIEREGEAQVSLGQRPFTIKKQFIDDLTNHDIQSRAASLQAALLILHAPTDDTVGIGHASDLFLASRHPKSFVSLDTADHLLSDKRDAAYAAGVIAAWSRRYLSSADGLTTPAKEEVPTVSVSETRQGKYQNLVQTGVHHLIADEPTSVGGLGSGPSPYDLLCAALGACTTMTLRMYADRKGIPADRISCDVAHEKTHNADMGDAMDENAVKPDHFIRTLLIEGDIEETVLNRMFEIADRCPVHRTLETGATVSTQRAKGTEA